jgi:hypothetical protein
MSQRTKLFLLLAFLSPPVFASTLGAGCDWNANLAGQGFSPIKVYTNYNNPTAAPSVPNCPDEHMQVTTAGVAHLVHFRQGTSAQTPQVTEPYKIFRTLITQSTGPVTFAQFSALRPAQLPNVAAPYSDTEQTGAFLSLTLNGFFLEINGRDDNGQYFFHREWFGQGNWINNQASFDTHFSYSDYRLWVGIEAKQGHMTFWTPEPFGTLVPELTLGALLPANVSARYCPTSTSEISPTGECVAPQVGF